jgi:uncharacterized protein (TIGR03000 family)
MAGLPALAAAALLFAAAPANARGPRGGGGVHGGAVRGGGVHRSVGGFRGGGVHRSVGGFRGGTWHRGWDRDDFRRRDFDDFRRFVFVPGFGWGWGWGWGWGYPYRWGGYPYYSGSYAYSGPTYNDYSSYYAPEMTTQSEALQTETPENPNDALIGVAVPPDAQVWFNGKKTSQTGTFRVFETPPLDPGSDYAYQTKVQWKQDGRDVEKTRKLSVRAGDHLLVNFLQSPQGEVSQTSPSSGE